MGIVYKAHDLTLDRDVALKFLPRDVSSSPEERGRFIHEAKAASALDHPNICTIYETGETPDGQLFIAMGYYEGTPLSKRIEKGRIEIGEAIWITSQIAEGLHAAHQKGIVHRDIKSSNIIVTDNGQVKILDFGLAHRTGLSKLTKTGTTVGTASYMSPEQARGEKIDHRSDLWSLGVILYEMVTGKLPFRGDHEMAILYSVVNEQPAAIENDLPDASPELVHILRRALEKEAAERYQSASDMLIDLRRLKKETSRTGYPAVANSGRKFSARSGRILMGGIVIVVLCAAGYYYLFRKGVELNANFVQRKIELPSQNNVSGSISPDGKWIVFAAADNNNKMDLYIVSSAKGTPKRITNDSTGLPIPDYVNADPRISPDNHDIVYTRFAANGQHELCTVPLVGGQVTKIGEGVYPKWSPDGKRIGYIKYPHYTLSKKAEFWTIDRDGKNDRREIIDTVGFTWYDPTIFYVLYYFDWSPDGNSIAWLRRNKQLSSDILIHNLTDGTEYGLTHDATVKKSLCWMPNNMIVYSSAGEDGNHLWAIPHVGGTPAQITRGTGSEAWPSTNTDGSILVCRSTTGTDALWSGRTDGSEPKKITTEEIEVTFPDILQSSKKIIFHKRYLGCTSSNLAMIDRDGNNERLLTRGGEYYSDAPNWSPNGEWVEFISRKTCEAPESFKVYILNPKTMEQPRLFYDGWAINVRWTSDSTLRMYSIKSSKTILMYLDGRKPVETVADSILAWFVDDGKYVLYRDFHENAQANPLRIVPIDRWRIDGGINPKVFDWGIPNTWIGSGPYGRSRFRLACDPDKGDLWKIWLPNGRKELIKRSCDPLKGMRKDALKLSWDENEYVFSQNTVTHTSILAIENLFK